MRSVLLSLAAAVLVALTSAAHATEKSRIALVVSNGAYTGASPLSNPGNDARIVRRSLEATGFKVIPAPDLGIEAFRRALKEFRTAAEKAEVALIYYAGHGIEAKGENWLIPVDAKLNSEQDLPDEAVNLQRVLDSVQGASLRVVILDACRNNPFGRQWKTGTRSVTRGLSGLDADDVLVIYAAAPGQVASDGSGANSPFATAIAERLPQPDLPVQLLGGAVRDDVLKSTGGQQRPYVSASITGTPFYLAGRGTPQAAAPAAITAKPAPAPVAAAAAPKPATAPVTPVKFSITAASNQDANFRQARNKLRDRMLPQGLVWTPQEREAGVLFQLRIEVARSELVGQRAAEVTLHASCKARDSVRACPKLDWRATAGGTGPNFDRAEESAVDQAADVLAGIITAAFNLNTP
jgi:hypothetical protein